MQKRKKRSALGRRGFLKTGALGATAAVTLAGCGRKDEPLIPLLVPEDNILPGTERWVSSTCMLCPGSCGIGARLMQGEMRVFREGKEWRQPALQVKKIEGNPRHPINLGGTCALGQAAPQVLYDPDRIRTPLRRTGARGTGKYERISWDEAYVILAPKICPPRADAARGLAAISGASSQMRLSLLHQFMTAAGSDRLYVERTAGFETLREANRQVFGRRQLECHDLENANYLLSFGANFLESHTSPARYNLGLARFRRGRPGSRGRFVHAECRFSLTAANADEWLPVRPGTEGALALAMAYVILDENLYDRDYAASQVIRFEAFKSWVLESYDPLKVAPVIDIPVVKIARIAREFARNKPGIALAGGSALAHPHGLFTASAVQALNVLAGNPGKQGGITFSPSAGMADAPAPEQSGHWAHSFLEAADSIQTLILWDADPAYDTPAALGIRRALERIPFVVAFASILNDSGTYADLILPDLTFLETWDLAEPEVTGGNRVVSLARPVVRPMYEARDRAEVLLQLAARAGKPVKDALPDPDFKSFLQRSLAKTGVLRQGSMVQEDFESVWGTLLEEGAWSGPPSAEMELPADLSRIRVLEPQNSNTMPVEEDRLYLQPFFTGGLGTGRSANISWMQELPDPMSSVVWGSWVEINPKTAARTGITEGDLVLVTSDSGQIRVAALITPAARPDAVSIPFGYGHQALGRFASDRGASVSEILQPVEVFGSGEIAWGATRVRLEKTGQKASLVKMGFDH